MSLEAPIDYPTFVGLMITYLLVVAIWRIRTIIKERPAKSDLLSTDTLLQSLAKLRSQGYLLRNEGLGVDSEGKVVDWRSEVLKWHEDVSEHLRQFDMVEYELWVILGNVPVRDYPNTTIVNGDHLRFLRAIDERVDRLDEIVRRRHGVPKP